MKASERKIDPNTVERLLFARLLVPTKRALSREQVVKSVATTLRPPLSEAAANDAVTRALDRWERRGLIANAAERRARTTSNARAKSRKRDARPTLTPKARALAGILFGQPAPAIKSWEHAKQVVALSRIGRAAAAPKVLRVDDLAALILAKQQRVPTSVRSLPAVVDYLAWRALGVETSAEFDVQAVQRHLLRQLVPADVRVDQTVWRRLLAMRAIGADNHNAEGLLQALLTQRSKVREKSQREKSSSPTPQAASRRKAASPKRRQATVHTSERARPDSASRLPANDNNPRPSPAPTLAGFAAAVRQAAGMPTVARFHDDRAFIGSVWEQMHDLGLLGSMTLAEFKARLIAAHRDGLLRITRADLVGAMDPDEVERSEARYQDATFHFVALEAGGAR